MSCSELTQWSLHEFPQQGGGVASTGQDKSEADTGAFRMPTAVVTRACLPSLSHRIIIGDWNSVDDQFIEFCNKRSAGSSS